MDQKAIVIFDTNKLLQNPDDEKYYSQIELSGDFYKLFFEFIPENLLTENVTVAIPQICLEEIKQRKVESFDKRFDSLKSKYEEIKIIAHLLDSRFEEPKKKDGYVDFFNNSIEEYVVKNKLLILDLPSDDNFKPIIKRAVSRKKPFIKTKNDGSDQGFKDVIVWYSILDHDMNNYDHHIFFTQDGGFDLDCLDEFETKFGKKIIKIEDFDKLKTELLGLYSQAERDKVKIRSKVDNEYFKEVLQDALNDLCERYPNIDSISIINLFVDGKYESSDQGDKIKLNSNISANYDDKDGASVGETFDIEITLNDVFEIEEIDDSLICTIDEDLENDKREQIQEN